MALRGIRIGLVLALVCQPAVADFDIDPILPWESPGTSPGAEIQDRTSRPGYDIQIQFVIDSGEMAQVGNQLGYSCNQYLALGSFLLDAHSNQAGGNVTISVGPNGQVCFVDEYSEWTSSNFQFTGVPFDQAVSLDALKVGNQVSVTVNGQTITRTVPAANYSGGNNGIGIGREVNSYHGSNQTNSFPGTICSVSYNGTAVDTNDAGLLTGPASKRRIGPSLCGPAPPPPPPPPPTPCETYGQNSVECACYETPHPACDVCAP